MPWITENVPWTYDWSTHVCITLLPLIYEEAFAIHNFFVYVWENVHLFHFRYIEKSNTIEIL